MEKKTVSNIRVRTKDSERELKTIIKGMGGTLAAYEIASLAETMLMDVFPYDSAETNV